MRKIMFTGGGSAGHVTVNLALIPRFLRDGWSAVYIGSESGIERQLVAATNIPYIGIPSGKLRRYFDFKNFTDPFRVANGTLQAFRTVRREKPAILFSKGGFVSVPVVIAAWLNRVPIVIHESDITPGLANRIAMRFADVICTTFQESKRFVPADKNRYVGAVIRQELDQGDATKGKALCGFKDDKPVLLVMGGSLGAKKINKTLRDSLTIITEKFNVVHLCGKGNVDHGITSNRYKQYEYLNEELPHVLAAANIIVSRAGSNSIFEFLHLRKPMLLIPLTKEQSRGDQILNAQAFQSSGFCNILYEEDMTAKTLVGSIDEVYRNRHELIQNMMKNDGQDALSKVYEIIEQIANKPLQTM